jgi:hypothetical protein
MHYRTKILSVNLLVMESYELLKDSSYDKLFQVECGH